MAAYGINNLLQLQATTGVAGFALQDATPAILSWTAPNDGQLHRFVVFGGTTVTSTETGGTVHAAWNLPDGGGTSAGGDVGGRAAGHYSWTSISGIVGPGQVVNIAQSSALSAGAATLWAELWGS